MSVSREGTDLTLRFTPAKLWREVERSGVNVDEVSGTQLSDPRYKGQTHSSTKISKDYLSSR
jgi:hypothetical protein